MRALLALILACAVACGQQANTNWSRQSIAINGQSAAGQSNVPGPHVWAVPTTATATLCYLWTVGRPGQSFWTFITIGPPQPGAAVLPGGIVDLNPVAAVELQSGTHAGTYQPCPTSPWACGTAGYGWPFWVPPTGPIDVAVQSIQTDPAEAAGYRLTAAIHALR